jgi:hypothetical protein
MDTPTIRLAAGGFFFAQYLKSAPVSQLQFLNRGGEEVLWGE